jgi:hypothetical protein
MRGEHQARESNGRFAAVIAVAQFEEFRRAIDHRFAAQKEAVDSARRAIEELTETHADAHRREHTANADALKLAREQVEGRVTRLEEGHSRRLRVLEDHDLAAASKEDVKTVGTTAKRAGVGALVVGVVATINTIINVAQNNVP